VIVEQGKEKEIRRKNGERQQKEEVKKH